MSALPEPLGAVRPRLLLIERELRWPFENLVSGLSLLGSDAYWSDLIAWLAREFLKWPKKSLL